MELLTPPSPLDTLHRSRGPVVFCCGSIEEGRARPWAEEVAAGLRGVAGVLLNPRRVGWDASWSQEPESEPFRSQVQWELEGLERADVVLVHLEAGTRSPVSLLELGLVLGRGQHVVVSCEAEFWRRGNVVVTCERMGVPVYEELSAAVAQVERMLAATLAPG